MKKTFALFDFDGTLIRGDSMIYFLRYALSAKLCNLMDLLRFLLAGGLYTAHLIPAKRAKEMTFWFLKGKTETELTEIAQDFADTVLKPRLYSQGLQTIQNHLGNGHDVLLISASAQFYLNPLKDILGLTDVLATQFELDEGGRYTGRITGDNCRGASKPIVLQTYLQNKGEDLDYETSSAYGDSAHDLPMLSLCRHAYAVNPKKKLKQALAALQTITVLDWKETSL